MSGSDRADKHVGRMIRSVKRRGSIECYRIGGGVGPERARRGRGLGESSKCSKLDSGFAKYAMVVRSVSKRSKVVRRCRRPSREGSDT